MKTRSRWAKPQPQVRRSKRRKSAAQLNQSLRGDRWQKEVIEVRISRASKFGASRAQSDGRKKEIDELSCYPEGSYGHGRYLYMSDKIPNIGPYVNVGEHTHTVEVDHCPHDGSQRPGDREINEALYYRPAIPLPRFWHRRHPTTRGGQKFDQKFYDEQVKRVNGKMPNENFSHAFSEHLKRTFQPSVVQNTGARKVNAVIEQLQKTLDYLTSKDIGESIFPKHTKGKPAITSKERTRVVLEINAAIDSLAKQKYGGSHALNLLA